MSMCTYRTAGGSHVTKSLLPKSAITQYHALVDLSQSFCLAAVQRSETLEGWLWHKSDMVNFESVGGN